MPTSKQIVDEIVNAVLVARGVVAGDYAHAINTISDAPAKIQALIDTEAIKLNQLEAENKCMRDALEDLRKSNDPLIVDLALGALIKIEVMRRVPHDGTGSDASTGRRNP